MGRWQCRQRQEELFYATEQAQARGHPFYQRLNSVLNESGFDAFCERRCRRAYISGCCWEGKREQQAAVYANRRRVEGARGKSLLRRRGELLERPFAHQYETGALRRLHVLGCGNVAKRVLLQAAAFNLALILRTMTRAERREVWRTRKGFLHLITRSNGAVDNTCAAFRPGCKFTAQISPCRGHAAQFATVRVPVQESGF